MLIFAGGSCELYCQVRMVECSPLNGVSPSPGEVSLDQTVVKCSEIGTCLQ